MKMSGPHSVLRMEGGELTPNTVGKRKGEHFKLAVGQSKFLEHCDSRGKSWSISGIFCFFEHRFLCQLCVQVWLRGVVRQICASLPKRTVWLGPAVRFGDAFWCFLNIGVSICLNELGSFIVKWFIIMFGVLTHLGVGRSCCLTWINMIKPAMRIFIFCFFWSLRCSIALFSGTGCCELSCSLFSLLIRESNLRAKLDGWTNKNQFVGLLDFNCWFVQVIYCNKWGPWTFEPITLWVHLTFKILWFIWNQNPKPNPFLHHRGLWRTRFSWIIPQWTCRKLALCMVSGARLCSKCGVELHETWGFLQLFFTGFDAIFCFNSYPEKKRTLDSKDYNRHAYQWLPAPLEACHGRSFLWRDSRWLGCQVSKGDEIHIRLGAK